MIDPDLAAAVRKAQGPVNFREQEPPRPLMRELPPADPFPVDALGEVLAPAARAIHDRVQAPLAICGQSLLAAEPRHASTRRCCIAHWGRAAEAGIKLVRDCRYNGRAQKRVRQTGRLADTET